MIDSTVVMAQMVQMKDLGVFIGIGSGLGLSGIVGKIVWNWLSNPRKTCQYHDQMHTDIVETKTDVRWIKNHLSNKM